MRCILFIRGKISVVNVSINFPVILSYYIYAPIQVVAYVTALLFCFIVINKCIYLFIYLYDVSKILEYSSLTVLLTIISKSIANNQYQYLLKKYWQYQYQCLTKKVLRPITNKQYFCM